MRRLPTVPIPIPSRLYYGWIIVGTALIINGASAPLNPVIFSFFIGPMREEMGWSVGAVSLALTFRLVASAITAPLLGWMIDRFGPRALGLFSGLAAAGTLVGLYYVRELWMLYLLFALSGGVGIGAGPGGNLLTLVPVSKWFISKRGRAVSIATAGMAIGTVLAILAGQWMIQTVGWRQAWVVFGALVAIIIAPLSLLFLRDSPSDLGLRPDGLDDKALGHSSEEKHSYRIASVETDWTAKEVVRNPVTWLIIAALAIGGFASSGALVHRVAFWEQIGMSPALVAFGTVMDPLIFSFSVVIFGFVAERMETRHLGLFGGLVWSLSMLPMILSTGQASTIFAHNIVWAMGAGAYVTANNLIWPNYFGRRFLGTIRGIVLPVQVAASGLGAPLYGVLLDAGLPPTTLWMVSAVLFAAAGLFLFLSRPPQREPSAQETLSPTSAVSRSRGL